MTLALVGAGPGDPGLLTMRAVQLLGRADVVVHDALVSTEILDLVPRRAERIDVGKRPGLPTSQDLISELLVQLARSGKRVVRLKGGDPFVFGRGGEEALAARAAGLDVEVVPGITSSIAAPASAGIPVTHRGVSPAFTVVTGQRRPGDRPVDWQSLARFSAHGGSTIVVLMGVAARAVIATELLDGGLGADTPVAVVQRATTGDQCVVRGELCDLATLDVVSPATIVIGPVAAFDVAALDLTGDLAEAAHCRSWSSHPLTR